MKQEEQKGRVEAILSRNSALVVVVGVEVVVEGFVGSLRAVSQVCLQTRLQGGHAWF